MYSYVLAFLPAYRNTHVNDKKKQKNISAKGSAVGKKIKLSKLDDINDIRDAVDYDDLDLPQKSGTANKKELTPKNKKELTPKNEKELTPKNEKELIPKNDRTL